MAEKAKMGRRQWLKASGIGVLALGASQVLGSNFEALAQALEKTAAAAAPGAPAREEISHVGGTFYQNVPGLTPEITPNEKFYMVSINLLSDPNIAAARWKLEVGGLVPSPFTLTYQELLGLPAVAEYATLKCIGDPIDGMAMGNALWKGLRLRDLISRAGGAKPGAIKVVFRAADKYSDSFPLAKAMEDGVILAYQMNGQALPRSHGFPARVIVPGIYGMKNVKWVTELEVTNYDYRGYWEQKGWDDVAHYRTLSRIDLPRGVLRPGKPAFIAGVAFAGDRGISKVEVSLDGGRTWAAARLKPALSPYSWVIWAYDWHDPQTGVYQIVVRATDKTGTPQESRLEPPWPKGAAGLHTVEVRVA